MLIYFYKPDIVEGWINIYVRSGFCSILKLFGLLYILLIGSVNSPDVFSRLKRYSTWCMWSSTFSGFTILPVIYLYCAAPGQSSVVLCLQYKHPLCVDISLYIGHSPVLRPIYWVWFGISWIPYSVRVPLVSISSINSRIFLRDESFDLG